MTSYEQDRAMMKDVKSLKMAAKIIRDRNADHKNSKVLVNGLEGLALDITSGYTDTPQINRTDTIDLNLRRSPITLLRPDLTYLYQEIGIIRTAIDQPVDDALRGGVDFESSQLSADELKELEDYFIENIYEPMKTTAKWAELFGGAGLVVNTNQDPATQLSLKDITEKSPLSFYDADRWELQMPNKGDKPDELQAYTGDKFYYYGKPLHRSRVMTITGDVAPSLSRRILMGWGLSKVERMVRDLNEYIKANNLIFELLDEAKIDVYRLEGYKAGLMKPGGQDKMARTIGATNSMKSYLNAIIMDMKDEYEQKQLAFSGLAEMLKEIRIGMASAVRMPMTKLFGMSAAGFNSGEDDIENYNAMIESDIRSKLRPMIKQCISLACIKLFGDNSDVKFKFKSLRIMDQKDEENVKNSQQLRILNNYDRGLMTAQETMVAQRADGILISDKTSAEEGMTIDFPVPPIERVTQTLKEDVPESDNPAADKPKDKKEKKDDA